MDRKGRKDKTPEKMEGGSITCVTKTSTLQRKFKTAFFIYAYKYDESKVKTTSVCPWHSISS